MFNFNIDIITQIYRHAMFLVALCQMISDINIITMIISNIQHSQKNAL